MMKTCLLLQMMMTDGVFNYFLNLVKSFMVLLDCKDVVASGNGEHLA